jgi:hypothetical protein
MSVTCKAPAGKFTVSNPALGSAVESWTALMQTLAAAKPEWWTNVNVDGNTDMSDCNNSTYAGTGNDAVPVAALPSTFDGESMSEDGPVVDLQAAVDLQVMEHASSPGTTQDETVYGTAESRPLSDDDDTDDGL